MKNVDSIIVGQGLAGSLLAMRLLEDGHSVLVIDNAHQGAASSVAAGIINPVTGHRLNLTEGFAQFMPIAEQEYARLSALWGCSGPKALLQTAQQHRLIKNPGQADYLTRRLNDEIYTPYLADMSKDQKMASTPELSTTVSSDLNPLNEYSHPMIDRGFGMVSIKQTSIVDSQGLLKAAANYLLGLDALQIEKFDYSQLLCDDTGVRYKDIAASTIIFCEGYQAIYNPWLKDLPFKLAKGDVLKVHLENPIQYETGLAINLLNWGSWLLTNAMNNTAKLGSSYEWNNLDMTPRPENAAKLLESASANTKTTLKIIEHEVGIRPTTLRRQPFIGALSNLQRAYCFNGFGSKGCLLIPYYAQQMSEHIRLGTPLSKELSQCL